MRRPRAGTVRDIEAARSHVGWSAWTHHRTPGILPSRRPTTSATSAVTPAWTAAPCAGAGCSASDSLHGLTEDDREAFAALGVRTVIDLRRAVRGGAARPGAATTTAWTTAHITLEHLDWELVDARAGHRPRALAGRPLPELRRGRARRARRDARRHRRRANAAPVVVHCMAGKDRTGVVCALTLSLLGVSDDDIAADYALTTRRWPR